MTKLYEIIRNAAHAVGEYRNPDLTEFRAAIDPVLKALGESTIGADKVESIDIYDEYIKIESSYVCRGCGNTCDHTIPMVIVEAVDPIRAATERTLRAKLAESVQKLQYARNSISRLEANSQQAALELATFLKEQ